MKKRNGSRALLTELIVVVLIFTLCAGVLVQMFYYSVGLGNTAGARDAALTAAGNAAELLSVTASPEETLGKLGFTPSDGLYVLETEEYRLEAEVKEEEREAGTMLVWSVTALRDGETLFTLPGKSYRGGEDA